MKASIRTFHSPDIYDLEVWVPDDPDCFGYLLQVFVGPRDWEGEESFDFVVCTPTWLAKRYETEDARVLRHHLLVFHYDFEAVKRKIQSLVDGVEGERWEDIGRRLGRYGKWEFEDYREFEGS